MLEITNTIRENLVLGGENEKLSLREKFRFYREFDPGSG